jgi:hypothetical protein
MIVAGPLRNPFHAAATGIIWIIGFLAFIFQYEGEAFREIAAGQEALNKKAAKRRRG